VSGELHEELVGVPRVDARDVLGGQAGQHSAGAELDHRAHLHRLHRDHRASPVHLAQHLLPQLVLQRADCAHRLAGGIGQDRNRRRLELQAVDGLAKRRGRLLHQRRVRRQRDREDERAAGAGLERQALGLLHRRDLARKHELDVGVAVGEPQLALRRSLLANVLHLSFIETDDRDHAARVLVRGLGHDPTALLHQQQRRLPRDGARGCQRGDLAKAVARGHLHVLEAIALAPHLVRGPAHGHHARLDDLGAVQLLDRTLEAEPSNRHVEHHLSALECPPRRGVAVVQALAHAGLLHALAREQQRDGSLQADHFRPTSGASRPRSARIRIQRAERGRRCARGRCEPRPRARAESTRSTCCRTGRC